jgi:hypothetical protein
MLPFFDIDLKFDGGGDLLWISLTGGDGVKQFIQAEFARWFQKISDRGEP